MADRITPEVVAFIQSTIDSLEQLEVLLFLVSNPEREWNAKEISERITLAPEAVAAQLESLHSAGLLRLTSNHEPLYRYAPASSALAQEVADSLNRAYKEGRDSIIKLIYSRPMDNIRFFADAFKIREKD